MFEKIEKTAYPPKRVPLMVWDGKCGFCRYWIARWQKFTGNQVEYRPFQDAASDFPDVDISHFQSASRLIETDGKIYSGPRSAYRTFTYGSKWAFFDKWYESQSWFRKLSDSTYNWVAKNRASMFEVTRFLFGSDPHQVRPFWAIYLGVALYLIYALVSY